MKKWKSKVLKSSILLILTLLLVSTVNADPGAIWAVHQDGSRDDYFFPGEDVYLEGQNFEPNKQYYYTITDQDENSTTYQQVLKDGYVYTNSSGYIYRQLIWTIPPNDYSGHEYRVNLVYKETCCKIWTKKDTFYTIPEFGSIIIPVVVIVGILYLMRRD
mgnify:CR=1 FL=1